jgi:cold shock CspA family protein
VRGIVKTFDSDRGIGVIKGKNGGKYPVTLGDVISLQPLKAGQIVHFSFRYVNDHVFATNVGVSVSIKLEEP